MSFYTTLCCFTVISPPPLSLSLSYSAASGCVTMFFLPTNTSKITCTLLFDFLSLSLRAFICNCKFFIQQYVLSYMYHCTIFLSHTIRKKNCSIFSSDTLFLLPPPPPPHNSHLALRYAPVRPSVRQYVTCFSIEFG